MLYRNGPGQDCKIEKSKKYTLVFDPIDIALLHVPLFI